MPGPSRIDLVGMLCSCIGHAAIFGGLLLSSSLAPPRKLAPNPSSAPLVVTLFPVDRAKRPASPNSNDRKADSPAFDSGDGSRRPASTEAAVGPTASIERPLSSDHDGTATSPSGGMPTTGSPAEINDYQRRLYEEVAKHARYPSAARRLRLAGVTHLAFRLDRLGNVLESWVQDSSGSEVLDTAALDALKRALPLPPIPPSLPSPMNFEIEIDSSLMKQLALSQDG